MKGYSSRIPENCASARLEGTNISHKDLIQVCGVIRNKKSGWALAFLEKAAEGEVPVLYRTYCKKVGHRRELGGRKGRYPEKAAAAVLKLLKSALANGKVAGLGGEFTIISALANRQEIYPRMSPKGRRVRSSIRTSRIEIVVKGSEIPKGVSVTPPKKEEKKEAKAAQKQETAKPEAPKPAAPPVPTAGSHVEHKHEAEKQLAQEKARPAAPHQHGENDKR